MEIHSGAEIGYRWSGDVGVEINMFTVFVYMCNVFNMSKQVTKFLGAEIVIN